MVNRDASVLKEIDEKRDQAEFLVAYQRWAHEDVRGCREQLELLLARNPLHCDARLLMADVLLSTEQPQAALAQVQEALKHHANNADVQYAMGLTLEANDRPDEAVAYYERASKAAPDKVAYVLSYRTACEAAAERKTPARVAMPHCQAADLGTPSVPPAGTALVSTANSASSPADVAQSKPVPKVAMPGAESAGTAGPGNAKEDSQSARLCPGSSIATDAASGAAKDVAASASVKGRDRSAEFLERGQEALKNGLPKLAADFFRNAAECNPQSPQIPITAAIYALKGNDAKMAVEILTPAAKSFPGSAAVLRCLGIAQPAERRSWHFSKGLGAGDFAGQDLPCPTS